MRAKTCQFHSAPCAGCSQRQQPGGALAAPEAGGWGGSGGGGRLVSLMPSEARKVVTEKAKVRLGRDGSEERHGLHGGGWCCRRCICVRLGGRDRDARPCPSHLPQVSPFSEHCPQLFPPPPSSVEMKLSYNVELVKGVHRNDLCMSILRNDCSNKFS